MDNLNFYIVDLEYVNFLKTAEIEKRGFSCVPDMDYADNRKPKFLCGIVLEINDLNYYVPVSSYKKKQPDNFLIKIDKGTKISGSLRFNFMFPVPKEILVERKITTEPDRYYRNILSQELRHCIKHQDIIRQQAERTYKRVLEGKNPVLVDNSCDFLLLERKCLEYSKEKGYIRANDSSLNSKMDNAKQRIGDTYLESQRATLEACDLVLQNKSAFPAHQIARAEQLKAEAQKNIEKRTKLLKDGH